MYGYICPDCGAHLDPGEICDCITERREHEKENSDHVNMLKELLEEEASGQLRMAV